MKLTKKLKKDDKDWFALIDKNNLLIHKKYDDLNLKEIDISKNTFALSLIENKDDKKRYNYIKEQMEQHISDQKQRQLKNKNYDFKKKNSYIFPHINIKNYKKIKTKNHLGTKNENEEVLKLLLKRIDKKYSMKITESLKHKPVIAKGFNLSQSPYQTQNNYNSGILNLSNEDNFKSLNDIKENKQKSKRTYYFKKYLNKSLYNIIQKAEDEENIIKKNNNKNILNLKKTNFKYFTDSNAKKISTKNLIRKKLKIKENTFSYPIIDKLIFKGKKNFFNEAKEKLYETYLKKINSHEDVIKLISERHVDENEN